MAVVPPADVAGLVLVVLFLVALDGFDGVAGPLRKDLGELLTAVRAAGAIPRTALNAGQTEGMPTPQRSLALSKFVKTNCAHQLLYNPFSDFVYPNQLLLVEARCGFGGVDIDDLD